MESLSNLEVFYRKSDIPNIEIGDTVQVTLFLELPKNVDDSSAKKEKERIQKYEGVVISKHKQVSQIDSTITVRKMFQGGGIEKVLILNSPWIKDIKIMRKAKVKRAKLYYLRQYMGKAARLKTRL
jgi:large subunit ribosomal protein L19